MTKNEYLLSGSAPVRSTNLDQLISLLNSSKGIKVGDLKFSDVMLDAFSCHCIYAFCEGDNYRVFDVTKQKDNESEQFWYIGSSVSRALVERLGGHFAPRNIDFANGLLKHIAYVITNPDERKNIWTDAAILGDKVKQTNTFISNAFPIIKDLMLKIICFEENEDGEMSEDIRRLETELIKTLKPAFNYPKRSGNRQFVIKDINGNQILN